MVSDPHGVLLARERAHLSKTHVALISGVILAALVLLLIVACIARRLCLPKVSQCAKVSSQVTLSRAVRIQDPVNAVNSIRNSTLENFKLENFVGVRGVGPAPWVGPS